MLNTLIVIRPCLSRPVKKAFKKVYQNIGKSCSLIGKEFNSVPVHGDNDKYIKTKIKSYGDKANTNFQSKKIPKENAS